MSAVHRSVYPAGGGRQIALAVLDNAASLNALTLDMIVTLDAALSEWARDPSIACVVLRGAGDKAFCAGGDVRALRSAMLAAPGAAPHPAAEAFFATEYTLDYRIHRYAKPLVVWGSGIVMGGGLGLFAGASHRVLSATSRIAMPEITIGLYPDVGGSWFLARLPARLGRFLALTGSPLDAADALRAGLGDHVLAADGFDALFDALCRADWPATATQQHNCASAVLARQEVPVKSEGPLYARFDTVRRLMGQGGLDAAAAALRALPDDDPWLATARDNFLHGSPTSAAIAWQAAERAKHQSLAEVLRMELTLSVNVCARPDYNEGVRALLVDKDRQPHWCRGWQELDCTWIDSHFESPWPVGAHPLAGLEQRVAGH